jgi:hypothetical protein
MAQTQKKIGRPRKEGDTENFEIRIRVCGKAKKRLEELARREHRTIIQQASLIMITELMKDD